MSIYESFLADTVSEQGETQMSPLPHGDYYATLEGNLEEVFQDKEGEGSRGTWRAVNVRFTVTEPDNAVVEEGTQLPRRVRQLFFLNTNEAGEVDWAKSTQFNRFLANAGAPTSANGRVDYGGHSVLDILEGLIGQRFLVRLSVDGDYNKVDRVMSLR